MPDKKLNDQLKEYAIIGDYAFKNSIVENILLKKTHTIGLSAFENCKELKLVIWKDSNILPNHLITFDNIENYCKVDNKKETLIQNSAFKGCDKLETVIFPNNKCIIEKDAFAHCKSLRTVVLLGSGTEIYDDPFIGCKDLTIICKKGDNELCAFARAHSFRIIEI